MSDDIEQARKRNEEIIRQGKTLLDQANTVRKEYARVYDEGGITREQVQLYVESEHVGADGRKQVRQQVAALEEEIERDVQQVEQEHQAQNSPSPAKKRRRHTLI